MTNLFGAFLIVVSLAFLTNADSNVCVTHPWFKNCSNYQLQGITSDLNMLCSPGMMGNTVMPACTIYSICQQSQYQSSTYCQNPFGILSDGCNDMAMMGCEDYVSMCGPQNSTVSQCTSSPTLPLPTTQQTSKLISSMCSQMPMPGCSKCTGPTDMLNCDVLTVYSNLCLSMSGMTQCSLWTEMCNVIPDWPLCAQTENSDQPPVMRMFFHTGIVDYVLFEGWVPRTNGQYAGTFFAIIVMAILYDALKFLRFYLETKWTRDALQNMPEEELSLNGTAPVLKPVFNWKRDIARASLQMLEVAWGLLVMLVAMTYNVGLFLALLVGAFIGSMIFGRFLPYQPKSKALCH